MHDQCPRIPGSNDNDIAMLGDFTPLRTGKGFGIFLAWTGFSSRNGVLFGLEIECLDDVGTGGVSGIPRTGPKEIRDEVL